jgi:hypothetical protein
MNTTNFYNATVNQEVSNYVYRLRKFISNSLREIDEVHLRGCFFKTHMIVVRASQCTRNMPWWQRIEVEIQAEQHEFKLTNNHMTKNFVDNSII